MTALGICVVYQAQRPVVTVVAVGGSRDSPELEQSFDIKTGSTTLPDQVNDLVRALRSKIMGLSVEACVIRIADFTRTASNRQAPRNRLMIEGALTFACRDQAISNIHVLTGKDVGQALSMSKADAVAAGAALDVRRPDAASAALAGLN